MAVIYSVTLAAVQEKAAPDAPAPSLDRLRSEHELDPRGRINLEMTRLWSLVQRVNGAGSPYQGKFNPQAQPVYEAWWGRDKPPSTPPSDDAYQSRVEDLNKALPAFDLSVLTELAKCGLEVELGYQTGLSLRDSADPPGKAPSTATGQTGPAKEAPGDVKEANADPGEIQGANAGPAEVKAANAGPGEVTAANAGPADINGAEPGPADIKGAEPGPADIKGAEPGPADIKGAEPGPADANEGVNTRRIKESLNRDRVAIIQERLTILAPHFPDNAAKIVSSSLGRWSDLAQVTLYNGAPGRLRRDSPAKKEEFATEMERLLLRQGDTWLALLLGEQSTSDLLSPEAYVAAGDAALRRTGRIIGKVVWRYKWALLILLVALAGALAGAAVYLGGASKLWTSIGAFAGTVGITWKGIANGIPKLAGDAERPIFGLEEVEAMAWSITTLPDTRATRRGVKYLREAGAGPRAPLGSV